MAVSRALFPLLLCLGAAARAQDWSDLASLEFFPRTVPPGGAEPTTARLRSVTASADAAAAEEAAANEPFAGRSADEILRQISRRLESIDHEVATHGERSSVLVEELDSLAALYEELGEHASAIAALERAVDVIRINHGLYSLDQADLLERLIASSDAAGDRAKAAAVQQDLLELTDRHPTDSRVASILAACADREMKAVHRNLEAPVAPQVTIHVEGPGAGPSDPPPPTGRFAALMALHQARRLYTLALGAAIRNGGHGVPDLFDLEEESLETYAFEASHPELFGNRQYHTVAIRHLRPQLCDAGQAGFENHVTNVSRFRQSPTAVGAAIIRLADWQLLCNRNGEARDTYAAAIADLLDANVPESKIAGLFSRDVPVALPALRSPASATQPPQHYRGYFDVSFVVGRYGDPRRIDILDASPDASSAVARRLKGYISERRFRPQIVDGQLAESERVSVRYYFDY